MNGDLNERPQEQDEEMEPMKKRPGPRPKPPSKVRRYRLAVYMTSAMARRLQKFARDYPVPPGSARRKGATMSDIALIAINKFLDEVEGGKTTPEENNDNA